MGSKWFTGGVVAASNGRIQFDFMFEGVRYRPSIRRPPSEANLRRARERLEDIKRQIELGTFSFAEEFPDYRFLHRVTGTARNRSCSGVFDEFLSHCAARLARGDLASAEKEARSVQGDAGAELRASAVLAEVALRRERFADAVAVTEAAERTIREQHLAPVPDLEFLRGDALARLGRYPEAQAAFEAEIRSFPRNVKAYTRLAIVYGLRHRTLHDVDALLEAMVAARPGRETFELAANTLESMGDAAGARAWRRRALLAHPSH